jgi:hypothetical protein
MPKIQYTPPWKLSMPWKPTIQRACDEWMHRTWFVVVPFLGMVTWWVGPRDFTRWFCTFASDGIYSFVSPHWEAEALIREAQITAWVDEGDGCRWPEPMSAQQVFELAMDTLVISPTDGPTV